MKKHYEKITRVSKKCAEFSCLLLLILITSTLKSQVVQTFSFNGAVTQSFVVPPCVTSISVDVRGAQGANAADKLVTNSTGGLGGRSVGVLAVTTGQVLYITVGGAGNVNGNGGFNGGGTGGSSTAGSGACNGGPAGGGGGASDIRNGGTALANRVIVGGGGGGSGRDYCNGTCLPCGCGGSGGVGGGLTGGLGQAANNCSFGYAGSGINGGAGAGNTSGGNGGQDDGGGGNNGSNGALGVGGNGGSGSYDVAGGGGGGGFYGGGGGGSAGSGSGVGGGGGGGGSSYFSGLTNTITTPAFQSGDGLVTLSYNFQGALTSAGVSASLICSGGSATLSANGQVSYTWSPGGSNANNIVVSPTSTSIYTLQGTNSLGCVSSTVIPINVNNSVPILTVSNNPPVVCAGKPIIFTATGANTYTWSNGIINNASFVPASTGVFTVTGENGCGTSTAVIGATVNPIPTVTASVNNPTVCNGSSVILNGGGATTFTWSGGVINNTAFAPPTTTNYTVTGTAANGCTATAVVGVTVLITPNVPPVVTPTSVCLGTNATLTAVGATGYTWTPGLGLNSFSAVVSPPTSTTYTLFRSNGACTSTTTVNLVINALPFANATATPSLICAGDPVALNVIGGITYTWLPGGFTSANFTFYPNSSASYTATSSNGSCTATGVVQVSVNASPIVGINTSTSTVCAGGNVTLTATGNAATYTWLPGNSNNASVVVNPTTVSQYTLIGNNTANCSNRQTQLIIVNPLPPLVLNSSVPFVCSGTTAVLSIANATVPGVTYSWSSNSGSGSTSNVSPTVTTTYFASAVTNSTGCSSAGSLALTVNISTFVVSSPTAICRGNSATIIATGAANSYNWNVSGVGNTPSITVSPTLTTTYIVTGVTGGCSNSISVPLIVNPLPNVVATAVKPQICRLENGTVTATGANSYTWNNGANTTSITINSLTITTTFTVTGTDIYNCVKSNTVTQFVATCLGLETNGKNQDLGLSIFPNPNQGNFTISSEVNMNVIIMNALGQLVFNTQVLKDQQKDLTLGNLPNGIYFIVAENNGIKVSKKIVIEK